MNPSASGYGASNTAQRDKYMAKLSGPLLEQELKPDGTISVIRTI